MPHTPSLLRVARRLMPDPGSAEDLVQDAMLAAWRGFGQFRTGTNARAWLFRILMNTFHAQGRKGQPTIVALAQDIPADSPLSDAAEVGHALQDLTVEHRTVLLLAVIEGFTCQEMANILNLPIGTVMSRLSRARRSLRERIAPKCVKKEAS